MCGIVGLVNGHPVARDLVAALGRLEYRGYDSAGVAVAGPGFAIHKVVGCARDLSAALEPAMPTGRAGIGHTRWATHGRAEARNAHPHAAGGVAVVHNGIIENHAVLRAELEAEGAAFRSDTDSEVIPHLIAAGLARGADFEGALRDACARLDGAYGIAAICADDPGRILVARQGSPLVVADGADSAAVASDPVALTGIADRYVALEDGDVAELTQRGLRIRGVRPVRGRGWNPVAGLQIADGVVRQGSHTRREVSEQAAAVEATTLALSRIRLPVRVRRAPRLQVIACGSSLYAAAFARGAIERAAGIPVDLEIASEFRDRAPPLAPRTAVVLVSQSGETADTLAAMRIAEVRGLPTIGVVNVPHSAIGRTASLRWPTVAGAEVGVAATKSFAAQAVALLRLGIALGEGSGRGDEAFRAQLAAELETLPAVLAAAEACEPAMIEVAREIAAENEALFIGRGAGAALALEGALKLKELSYIRAEGYAAGELKHGPIALVREASPVIACAPGDAHLAKTLSNAQAVRARGARVTVLTDAAGAAAAREVADRTILLPGSGAASGFAIAVALQLLSVHAAEVLGHDVDRPRNLAKSVTVE
jgi:glucosamine--fructose-6-phosphate aminotransferase (isomerizing)